MSGPLYTDSGKLRRRRGSSKTLRPVDLPPATPPDEPQPQPPQPGGCLPFFVCLAAGLFSLVSFSVWYALSIDVTQANAARIAQYSGLFFACVSFLAGLVQVAMRLR